jgi:hypothetical protein
MPWGAAEAEAGNGPVSEPRYCSGDLISSPVARAPQPAAWRPKRARVGRLQIDEQLVAVYVEKV